MKSALEETFAFQLRAAKLFGFEREFKFHPVRRWRFDFAFPELKIGVEIQGGIFVGGRHSRPMQMMADYEKMNHAQLDYWCVLQFGPHQIKDGSALAFLERVYALRVALADLLITAQIDEGVAH